jgi:hypothetical protein
VSRERKKNKSSSVAKSVPLPSEGSFTTKMMDWIHLVMSSVKSSHLCFIKFFRNVLSFTCTKASYEIAEVRFWTCNGAMASFEVSTKVAALVR